MKTNFKKMSAKVVILLFFIALICAIYAFNMYMSDKIVIWWLMVAAYWVTLTVKNMFDYMSNRNETKNIKISK